MTFGNLIDKEGSDRGQIANAIFQTNCLKYRKFLSPDNVQFMVSANKGLEWESNRGLDIKYF